MIGGLLGIGAASVALGLGDAPEIVTGSGSGALSPLAGSGSGAVTYAGTSTGYVRPGFLSASASATGGSIAGSATGYVAPGLLGVSSAIARAFGSGGGALSSLDGSGSGTTAYVAAGGGKLASLEGGAFATLLVDASGEGAFATLEGTGDAGLAYDATADGALASLDGAALAGIVVAAAGDGALSPLGGDGAIEIAIDLSGAGTLSPFEAVSAGLLELALSGAGTLSPLAGEASGRVRVVPVGRRWAEPARSSLEAVFRLPHRSAAITIFTREAYMPASYRVGDTLPPFDALLRINGQPRPIVDGETATLVYRRKTHGDEVERAMTVASAAAGRVIYSWQTGELVEGTYVATVVLDDGAGGIESFPAGELVVTRRA